MPLTVAQTPVQHHPANTVGRDFVVADLHGCLDLFWRLLRHVGFNPELDRVYSTGDLTDRGPNSWGCLRLLKMPWFFSALGNHDALLLSHLRMPTRVLPHEEAWLADISPSLGGRQAFADAWIETLSRLPAVHVIGAGTSGRFQVVHAELLNDGSRVTEAMIDSWSFSNPTKSLERATYGRALINAWKKDAPVRNVHDPKMGPIFCGHTIVPRASWLGRQVYLDMGAFLGHAEDLDEGENLSSTPMRNPGLVMVEATRQPLHAWLAPTRQADKVVPLTLSTLDTY